MHWMQIFTRVVARVRSHQLTIAASSSAFYAVLASVPALAASLSLLNVFTEPHRMRDVLNAFSSLLPEQAAEMIETQITQASQLSRELDQLDGAFFIQWAAWVILLLWSANRGTKGIVAALNRIYEEEERRGIVLFIGITMALTIVGIILLIGTIGIVLIVPSVLGAMGLSDILLQLSLIVRWIVLLVFVIAMVTLLYRFGPNRTYSHWRFTFLGAAGAAGLWLVFSVAFANYSSYVGGSFELYGSLSALIGFMIWLWLSMLAILIGAELEVAVEAYVTRSGDVADKSATTSTELASTARAQP